MKTVLCTSMVAFGLFISACGKSSGGGGGGTSAPNNPTTSTKTESLSYEFEFNGCKTGRHQFSSTEELCTGLRNDTLNNSCAIDLRADFFQKNCPSQSFDVFSDARPQDSPSNAGAKAGDVLNGDTLNRTILAGQGSLVLFKNPTGESANALIYCVPDAETAKSMLSDSKMGGVMLTRGTSIVLKNDTSSSFNDGTNLKGSYIKIECK
jgi:hypothetical protein